MRGIDSSRVGERRGANDFREVVVPRRDMLGGSEESPVVRVPVVVPGERSGERTPEPAPVRRRLPVADDTDEPVYHLAKPTRRTPVARRVKEEPWWYGRIGELTVSFGALVAVLVLIGFAMVLFFTNWLDGPLKDGIRFLLKFFNFLSEVEGE